METSDLLLAESPKTEKRLNPAISFLLQLPHELELKIVEICFIIYGITDFPGYQYEEYTDKHDEYYQFRNFDQWRDVANLAATCRHLYEIITPILYTKDRMYNDSSALLISAKKGNVSGILKSLHYGSWIGQQDATEFQYFWDADGQGDFIFGRRSVYSDMTSLHWASYYRQKDAMVVLLQHGAEPDRRITVDTYDRDTRFKPVPYHQVLKIFYNHMKFISPLEDRLWLRTRLKHGANALYYALIYGDPSPFRHRHPQEGDSTRNDCARIEATKLLLDAGVSLVTHKGIRLYALHQACGCGDFKMAKFLLENTRSYPRVKDLLGNTPMHYVAMCCPLLQDVDLRPLIELLVQHGAKINEPNYAGCTPLQLSVRLAHYPLHDMGTEGHSWVNGTNMDSFLALMEFGAYVSPDHMPHLCQVFEASGMKNDATVQQALAKVEEMSANLEMTPESDIEITNEEARRVYAHMNLLRDNEKYRPYVSKNNRRAWTAQQWMSWWQ